MGQVPHSDLAVHHPGPDEDRLQAGRVHHAAVHEQQEGAGGHGTNTCRCEKQDAGQTTLS